MSLRELYDTIKLTNIWIVGSQKKKENGRENICIMADKFPNSLKYINIHIQEAP